MNFFAKLLVISVICLLARESAVFAQPSNTLVPVQSYTPVATDFSPNFADDIKRIDSLVQSKDKEALNVVAEELLARQEAGPGRGDEYESYFLAGFAKLSAGDLVGAQRELAKSIEFRQSNPNAHLLLAQTYFELDRCQDVLLELDQVKFLSGSETASSYLLRAQCLAKLDRQLEAETLLTAARKVCPGDTQIKKLSLLFKSKALSQGAILNDAQTAELEGDLPELAAANPEDTKIQLMYGNYLLKKGDILTKSLELDLGEKIAREQVAKFNLSNEDSIKLLFDILLKKRMNKEANDLLLKAREKLPRSKLLEECQKQLSIEVEGLRVLKYDRR